MSTIRQTVQRSNVKAAPMDRAAARQKRNRTLFEKGAACTTFLDRREFWI
jgi:hypothetical protein